MMESKNTIIRQFDDHSSVVSSEPSEQTYETVSYCFDDFFERQAVNDIMPNALYEMCAKYSTRPDITRFGGVCHNTIRAISQGDDANNIVVKNEIKGAMNMISTDTYDSFFESLRKLDHNSQTIQFLASELVRGIVVCPKSAKGVDPGPPAIKNITHVCIDLMCDFRRLEDEDPQFKRFHFSKRLLAHCREQLAVYLADVTRLNESNESTAESFKAFMTCVGMMFEAGLADIEMVVTFMETIVEALAKPGEEGLLFRDHYECKAIVKGYQYLMDHVIYAINHFSEEKFASNVENIRRVIAIHQELNERNTACFVIDPKGKRVNPIRGMDKFAFEDNLNKPIQQIAARL